MSKTFADNTSLFSKVAIEVGFSNNRDKEDYLSLMFSCTNVQLVDSQKSLGLTLNLKNEF